MDVPNQSQITYLSEGVASRSERMLFIRIVPSRRIEEHMEVNQRSALTDDLSEKFFGDPSRYILDEDRATVAFHVRGWHRSRKEIDWLEH